jgi:type IV pilus assembly protein PilB
MVSYDVKRVQKGTESFMVSFDFTKTPVTQIADYIIIAASKHNTSDIHFDPREDGMMVRFRIDGDCQDYTFVPKAYEKNLTTRLKLLANMNITESRLPQDGAIKGTFGDQYLDMRVSALPLNEGEKIVIRILDYTRSLQGIDSLGFHPKNLEKVKRMMEIPNGIILTTGATGSGKSTTTYSILSGLNTPEKNIITVEDPIEMNIEGINQVQVNAEIGMTFAAALRSILRQDPNVILIGEIRDSETAQIAVRASITGHLVLSTIHTNNALATVERLLDMDVERYLLSTALSGIISQRLAKQLCPDCRYQRETTKYEKKVFKKYMNMDVAHVWDANPKGCDHCRKGYHGRIAVHEVLELDDNIRSALSNEKLEKKELAKMVYSGNTITMLQDALIKCLEGKTSFEEVYRTIEIESEDDDNYENEIENEIKESIPKQEETVTTSDDLLETPISKAKDANDISSMLSAPSFTAADFADAPEVTSETKDEDKKQDGVQQTTPMVKPTVPVQQKVPTNQPLPVGTNIGTNNTQTAPMVKPTAPVQQPVPTNNQPLPVGTNVINTTEVKSTTPVQQTIIPTVQQTVNASAAKPAVAVQIPTIQTTPITAQQNVQAPLQSQPAVQLQQAVNANNAKPAVTVQIPTIQQATVPLKPTVPTVQQTVNANAAKPAVAVQIPTIQQATAPQKPLVPTVQQPLTEQKTLNQVVSANNAKPAVAVQIPTVENKPITIPNVNPLANSQTPLIPKINTNQEEQKSTAKDLPKL